MTALMVIFQKTLFILGLIYIIRKYLKNGDLRVTVVQKSEVIIARNYKT